MDRSLEITKKLIAVTKSSLDRENKKLDLHLLTSNGLGIHR